MADEALRALFLRIADGDTSGACAALRSAPDLAAAALARGATRAEPTDHFLVAITHHVYAGDTALHVAAAAHDVVVVDELAALGADVDATNRRGARPLHYAVDGGPGADGWDPDAQRRTVARLLALGADPDAPDRNGTPPLLRAVRNRCADAVDALLAGGADPTVTNPRGASARQLATTTTGRGGTGSAGAKVEQARIIDLLDAATAGR